MKLKTFKTFLTEMAYQNLSKIKFNDKFDKAFGEYALNEVSLKWNEEERKECRKLYGGIDVGIVYYGGKISSEEQLSFLESLSKGMSYPCNLISATPDKETAISFMEYVKSYDEITMMRMLITSLERGSSGERGSFLLTLKPQPSNVIASTFGPTKKKLTRTAEEECILFGDVEIERIKIVSPLTKEHWFESLKKNFLELFSSDFFNHWLDHHNIKITKQQTKELINLLKTEDDVLEFLRGSEKNNRIFYSLSYSDIKINKIFTSTIFKYLKFNVANPYLLVDNEKIKLENKELINELRTQHKKSVDSNIKEKFNEVVDYDSNIYFDENKGTLFFDTKSYELFHVLKIAKERKIKLPSDKISKRFKEITFKLKELSNEFILTKTLKETSRSDLEIVYNIFRSFITLFEVKFIINEDLSFIKQSWNWFYHSFARGEIKDTTMLNEYAKIIQFLLSNNTFLDGLSEIK